MVRFVPAREPAVAAFAIAVLALVELVFAGLFLITLVEGNELLDGKENVRQQQFLGFTLGSALLALAAILTLYRKFFVPDVMIVKRRKLKYEDLM